MLLFTFSCSEKINVENCRIVTMHNLTEKKLDESMSEIFHNKKTIILDDSKGVYPSVILKILCRNNKLFILSRLAKVEELLVFNITGEFLFKVGDRGRAKNEYIYIDGFDINDKGDIFINDIGSHKILRFNDKGQFLEVIIPPSDYVYSMKNISDNNFLFCLAEWASKQPKKELIKIHGKEETIYSYYGKHIDDDYQINSPDFTVAGENIFFSNNLSDFVYNLNMNGDLVEKIYFDFGNRRIPSRDKVNLERQIDYEQKYRKYTTLMNFCCMDENYIYGGLYDGMKKTSFVLDEEKQTIYKLDQEGFSHIGQIVGFDDKYLISYLDYVSYKRNPDAFEINISKALKNDKTVICLYY